MITATPERDSYLYEVGCERCMNPIPYPYEFGPVTDFVRSYINNKQVTFLTNADCNANCRHCFCPAAFPGQPKGFISEEIVDKTFEILKDEPKMVVSILGGEVMLYPEGCKMIADKAHERGYSFRLITNGFFGDDDKMVDYLINEIKPEMVTISYDEYHQEFIPKETIQNLINKIYGKTDIIIETCIDVDIPDFNYDRVTPMLQLEGELGLQQKKIFYLIDKIKKDGNARDNNLGYEKHSCDPGHCSSCGIVVCFDGRISIKCEFNSRPIHEDCKLWTKNILTDNYDFKELRKFLKTKRYWMDSQLSNEINLIAYSGGYIPIFNREKDPNYYRMKK